MKPFDLPEATAASDASLAPSATKLQHTLFLCKNNNVKAAEEPTAGLPSGARDKVRAGPK